MTEARMAQAAAGFARSASGLTELRALKFAFVGKVLEPGAANQWIESGGSS